MTTEICKGCGHSLSQHFRDVTGVARCLHTDSGRSTSGIIGMPWTQSCDCAEFVSPRTLRQREEQQRLAAKEAEETQKLIEAIRQRTQWKQQPET